LLLIALTAFFASQIYKTSCASAETVPSNITQAEKAVALSFNAVDLAQKSGANVTELTTQLNEAVSLLAQAENAYRNGDNITAVNTANAIIPIASKIESTAIEIKTEASRTRQNSLTMVISLSITAEIVLILVLFTIWRRLRQNHIKEISRMKPEAIGS